MVQSGRCSSCGAAASGRFCTSCGTEVPGLPCGSCGAPFPPGARFCPGCGTATAPGTTSVVRGTPLPGAWLAAVGAVILAAVMLALVVRGSPKAADGPAGDPGAPPDISAMTPRERFDRLYNRVMSATEAGETGTLETFGPMALLAYGQLDSVDADARYHAALLRLHSGDAPGAAALADTILAQTPGHLFGLILRGTVARTTGDSVTLARAYTEVLRVWDAEMAAGRPEYAEHQRMLDTFHEAALGKR